MAWRQQHYSLAKDIELLVSDDVDIDYFNTVLLDIGHIYKKIKGQSSGSKDH